MESMTHTVLESQAYDNALVIKYLCTATNFSRSTYTGTVMCRTLYKKFGQLFLHTYLLTCLKKDA